MADCTRKLRQERGASVVFALVIFLIVTIFSWTMVNGALTAAQNASMQREEEQAYLSVTSAARLFCQQAAITIPCKTVIPFGSPFEWETFWEDEHSDLKWDIYSPPGSNSFVIVLSKKNPDSSMWEIWALENVPSDVTLLSPLKTVQSVLFEMMKTIDATHEAASKNLTIESPEMETGELLENFSKVKVALKMAKDYSVTAEFSKDPPPASNNLQYYVVVTLKCIKEDNTWPDANDPNKTVVTRTMTWEVKSVERGRHS